MTPCRIALVLIVAVLPFSGCGRGCGSGSDRTRATDAPATTSTAPTTTSVSTTPTTTLAPAHAGPYELRRRMSWKAGDVVASESRTRTTGRVVQVLPDGRTAPFFDIVDIVEATWTERAAEVDAEGRRLRYAVNLNAWSRRRKAEVDSSIAGASLTVSGTGAERVWSFVAHANEPTPEARRWLDEHFGPRGLSDEGWLRVMLPDEPMAVGGTFHPDPALLAAAAAEGGLSVDPAGVSAVVVLQAVEGSVARSSFEAVLPLQKVPDSDVPWTKGGTLGFEGTMSVPLEPAPLILAELDRRSTLTGEAIQDETTLRYDFVTHERRTTRWGGNLAAASAGP